MAFASQGAIKPAPGWMGSTSPTLQQNPWLFAPRRNGYGAGIAKRCRVARTRQANVYCMTANGPFNATLPDVTSGDSTFGKLESSGTSGLFTLSHQAQMESQTQIIASSGPMLLPDQVEHFSFNVGAGKDRQSSINRENMGHYNEIMTTRIPQSLPNIFPKRELRNQAISASSLF